MGCCSALCTTRFIAVLGIVLSAAVIAGPSYLFFSGRDQSEILPLLKNLYRLLEEEYEKKILTETSVKQLRELLDDVGDTAWLGSLVSVCVAGTNILIDLLLLIGACCRLRCLALPWLILSLLEIIVLGIPTVIFFSLLGIYLYVENLLIPAVVSFSAPGVLVLISLTAWFIVLAAYLGSMGKKAGTEDEDQGDQEVQPLMSHEQQQGASTSYNLGHYPQYYPPHNPSAGPSAPPQTTPSDKNNPNLYPTLPA